LVISKCESTLQTHHPTVHPFLWQSPHHLQRHLHASTRPKMHSFVHGLLSPNPTAPHHESTPLNPATSVPSACVDHHWPFHLFDTVGSQRGSTEVHMRWRRGGGAGDSAGKRVSPENESKSIEVRPLSPSLSPTSAAVSIHPSVSHQQSSPRHRKTLPVCHASQNLRFSCTCGVPACACPGVACNLVLRISRGLRRHTAAGRDPDANGYLGPTVRSQLLVPTLKPV
jgi:hypothetical protein